MNKRTATLCFVLVLLLVVGNLLLPSIVASIYIRDSDVGLWFMAGVLLAELSLSGCVLRMQYGQLQWRILGAVGCSLFFVVCGFASALIVGPMSSTDGISYLQLTLSTAAIFTFLDLLILGLSKLWLVRTNSTPALHALKKERNIDYEEDGPFRGPDDSFAEGSQTEGRARFHFSFLFLFGMSTFVALFALLWRLSLDFEAVAYRAWRGYSDKGTPMLLVMVFFLWLLHASLLLSTLQIRWLRGMIASVLLAVFGCETLRRVEQSKSGAPLSYLDWEFCMIVGGFLTAHLVIGFTARWFGWELKQHSTSHISQIHSAV